MKEDSKTPDQKIRRYIYLRDGKRNADAEYAEWRKANYDVEMETIEADLLAHLNAENTEGIRTKAGTCFKKSNVSVTTADGDAFRSYVVERQAWELADWRPNKTAMNALAENGEALPPGVNRSVFAGVEIRKPRETH